MSKRYVRLQRKTTIQFSKSLRFGIYSNEVFRVENNIF
jgi:hypothetical protein